MDHDQDPFGQQFPRLVMASPDAITLDDCWAPEVGTISKRPLSPDQARRLLCLHHRQGLLRLAESLHDLWPSIFRHMYGDAHWPVFRPVGQSTPMAQTEGLLCPAIAPDGQLLLAERWTLFYS